MGEHDRIAFEGAEGDLPHASEIDRFVSAVRRGDILQPTQWNYSPAKWRKALESVRDPSESDRRLYQSGIYFHERLKDARARHSKLPALGLSPHEHVRLLVAAANHAAALDREYTRVHSSSRARLAAFGQRSVFGPALQDVNADHAARTVQLMMLFVTFCRKLPNKRFQTLLGSEWQTSRYLRLYTKNST